MTKAGALHQFFNGFGLTAYPSTSVPENAKMPYISYEVQTSSFGGGMVSIGASIWYRTDSESVPNAKADEIGKAIGEEGVLLDCDDGKIWITKGTPWCVNQSDPEDITMKLRYLNLSLVYFTL